MQNEPKHSVWAMYQKAWSDVSSTERQELLNQSVAEECVYSDPRRECINRQALFTYIEQFKQTMPGKSFKNYTFLDHHEQSLAEWMLYDETGAEMYPGKSYASFSEDGRLKLITGFFIPKE